MIHWPRRVESIFRMYATVIFHSRSARLSGVLIPMRRSGLVAVLLVVVFLLPMTSPIVGTDADSFDPADLNPYDEGTTLSQSGDLGSGTGAPLPA